MKHTFQQLSNINFNDLPELISESFFLELFNYVISNNNNFSKKELLLYLEVLGEKYEKFYNLNLITEKDKEQLFLILKNNTDFNDFYLISDLIFILFRFRIDKYIEYLKKNINSIKDKKIYTEVLESINEYEKK